MEEYDYIVVGAGSAGAPLAAGLSQDPAIRVLLLEAGPDSRGTDLPPEMEWLNPAPLWDAPDAQRFLYADIVARRTSAQPVRGYLRGRGLGGTSSINGMLAIRGTMEDFDIWAELGCEGWSSRDVLPTFIRLEDDREFGDRPYHGRTGPLPVSRAPLHEWGAVDRALCTAALDLGYPWAEDHNMPHSSGISPCAYTCRDDKRVSTNDAYLEPARSRTNLTVMCGAVVDRVLFDGRSARGLRTIVDGVWRTFRGHEILLSAGTVHSPTVLVRSGIGPPNDVRALGIDLVQAAPVGRNLRDHVGVYLGLELRPEAAASSLRMRHVNCCVRYSSGLAGAGANDMMMLSTNLFGAGEHALRTGHLLVSAFQTFSSGYLRVVTSDPLGQPEIDMRLLSDERDRVRMRDGMSRLVAIVRHPAVQAIAERVHTMVDGREFSELPDGAELDAWLLAVCDDTRHTVGTCRMGPPGDPRSVVNTDCEVLGTRGLRVVDASIMPEVPRANTHLSTVMIGEHMVRRILAKHARAAT